VFPRRRLLIPHMPHDADAEFDHKVLEMIEHSAVGAVPRTPAYQDALGRLRAARQVYPDADHLDGFVTARSLTARPVFHASNLDALMAGAIDLGALESNASIFGRYVASLPAGLRGKAEACRLLVAGRPAHHRKHHGVVLHDPVHTLVLAPGAGAHPGLPGNYLHGSLLQRVGPPAGAGWAIHLHDRDDGASRWETTSLAEALEKLQEVIGSAPFHLDELADLGFQAI
jgi:hypothetical protein